MSRSSLPSRDFNFVQVKYRSADPAQDASIADSAPVALERAFYFAIDSDLSAAQQFSALDSDGDYLAFVTAPKPLDDDDDPSGDDSSDQHSEGEEESERLRLELDRLKQEKIVTGSFLRVGSVGDPLTIDQNPPTKRRRLEDDHLFAEQPQPYTPSSASSSALVSSSSSVPVSLSYNSQLIRSQFHQQFMKQIIR